jgi:hypothetical protein
MEEKRNWREVLSRLMPIKFSMLVGRLKWVIVQGKWRELDGENQQINQVRITQKPYRNRARKSDSKAILEIRLALLSLHENMAIV